MILVRKQQIQYLLTQYLERRSSASEEALLFQLLEEEKETAEWQSIFEELMHAEAEDSNYKKEEWQPLLQKILGYKAPVRKLSHWKRIAVAASILFAVGLGSYFLFFNKSKQPDIAKTTPHDVKAPDKTKAIITLADGKTISIDSLTQLTQGNVSLTKNSEGKIVYNTSSEVSPLGGDLEGAYNTLTNPRGSKVIDMTLSDGSHVWLNAGSSVTYPVAFIGSERKVSITGEADFAVTHNEKMPFKVIANGIEIQDLGTEFNVNAYDDESDIKVTLLKGSVKVSNDADSKMIKPGEQAVAVSHSPFTIHQPDLDEVMAWKNGLFSFTKADIKTIMREVARWYDVEVVYTTDIKETFYVKASRNTSVSNIFKILETTGGVHLEIDGKKIIVKP